MTKTATLLLSGGIDSACCLKMLVDDSYIVHPLFIDFGQPAAVIERSASRKIAEQFGAHITELKVQSGLAFQAGEIRGRNPFLLTTALMHTAASSGLVVLGIHAGSPYYDCSQSFLDKIDLLVSECTDGRFRVAAPLAKFTKCDVYDYFRGSGISAASTHSCELGVIGGCGRCASCKDRAHL